MIIILIDRGFPLTKENNLALKNVRRERKHGFIKLLLSYRFSENDRQMKRINVEMNL